MKLALQYVSDKNGKTQSVMLPLADWEKLIKKLAHYEQVMKVRSDITEALDEARGLQKSKGSKKTLTDFLNEL